MRQFMKKGLLGVGILLCICLVNGLDVEAMEYQYDKLNRVTKVTYEDGSYVTYEYDANGNIVNTKNFEVKRDEDPSDDKPSDDKPSDGKPAKEVSRETNDKGKTTKITYDDGSYATYEYDDKGTLVKEVDYDSGGTVVRETTGNSIEDPNQKEDVKENPKEDPKEKSPIEKAIEKIVKGIKKTLKSFFDFFKNLWK